MSAITRPQRAIRDQISHGPVPDSPYGCFSPEGDEYWITNPRTPRPWVNIAANPRFGFAVSHTGSGFAWVDNSQLAVLTRWDQEFSLDASGQAIYCRDADTGELWSLSPAPVWSPTARHTCRHGIGYSVFQTACAGIESEWTLFPHVSEPVAFWKVSLRNRRDSTARLDLSAVVEWCCGVTPSPRREFHKLFLETRYDPARRTIFARNHMWDVPNARYGHWNTEFPYVCAFACSGPIDAAQGDKAAFYGRYGDRRAPEALAEPSWQGKFGRHEDAIGALRVVVQIPPGETREIGFVLAAERDPAELDRLLLHVAGLGGTAGAVPAAFDAAAGAVRSSWRNLLAAHRVETPEPTLNYLINDWVRYQAISARLWGRAGYYQQSGAFGFRDQLQDSQVWLTLDPEQCRRQLHLHASHQFANGSVYHWWHPLTEQGHVTRMADDLLWLAFVTANYIRETGRLDLLKDESRFLDDAQPAPLIEHVQRAFERVFERTSPRGLPYIGAGDWNDGLSAVGLQEKGESIWLAQFLAGLLADWAELYRRVARDSSLARLCRSAPEQTAYEFENRRRALNEAINRHGWDGAWYTRATLDDGSVLGSASNRVGRIFLNAQVWAILNDVATPERARQCFDSVREHLVSDAGALLLAPAFDVPDEKVGYITRYAPGLRENGGVYSHAATWAIAAACKMGDAELVGRLLHAINPALKDPDRYWAEPYVLPGNVDGPASPYYGRAGWTWYTGSAQWLHRVVTQWVLGVRPEWDGLRIAPCLPPEWNAARMTRPYRGSLYAFEIERPPASDGQVRVWLDGAECPDAWIPAPAAAGETHQVRVVC